MKFACGLALALLSLPALAQPRTYDFREKTLSNGLRVVTLEDASCPIVAVQVWYHVGSKDEAPDRQGFAHMFEHMMFRGTDRLGPKDHFDFIRKTGGECNAFTAFDNTTYVNVAPSNQLEMLLWLEAERLASLKIDAGGFETERRVVEEERRLGLNQPYGSVPEKLLPELFAKHPYRWSPIGQIPHLRAATADELQAFWDKFYVPNNATLVIVGDIRHDAAHSLAEKHFSWIPRCPEPPRVTELEPEQTAPKSVVIQEESGPVPIAGIAFRTVPQGHADGPALEVLANILGQGESSRLMREVVRKQKLAMIALAGAFQMEQAGFLGAGAILSPFGDAEKAFAALDAEIAKLKAEDASANEIEKAKNALLKGRVTAQLTVESKANRLGSAATFEGGPGAANDDVAKYRAVTAADVRRVANAYCVDSRRTTVHIKPTLGGMLKTIFGGGKGAPEDEGAAPPGAEALAGPRATPTGPKAAAKRPAGLPEKAPVAAALATFPRAERETKTLGNGLRVIVIPNREVPFVTMTLGLMAGASTENPERPGAASMACAMLTKGTKSRSADAIAEELDRLAIGIGGSAGHDSATVTASALSDRFGDAMKALAEVVLEPTFPADELETLRGQTSSGLMIQERQPAYQADREMEKLVFGDHPYSRPAGGTLADLKKLSAEDLAAWWTRHARPDAAVLLVAGDVTSEAAFAAAESRFGAWAKPAEEAAATPAPAFPAPRPTRIFLVDKKGAVQSQIRVGHLGITRAHPDHVTAEVMDQVFGGSFTSRLNAKLRVEKGLTYGISGGFSPRRDGGAFVISTFSKTPATAEAVRTILDEVKRLLVDAPTPEELDAARSFLTGKFARDRETPQDVAQDLWLLESLSLPADYHETFVKGAAATTSEQVLAAAKKLVNPATLAIVVVGDAERVKADLETIAPVTLVGAGKAKAGGN